MANIPDRHYLLSEPGNKPLTSKVKTNRSNNDCETANEEYTSQQEHFLVHSVWRWLNLCQFLVWWSGLTKVLLLWISISETHVLTAVSTLYSVFVDVVPPMHAKYKSQVLWKQLLMIRSRQKKQNSVCVCGRLTLRISFLSSQITEQWMVVVAYLPIMWHARY